MLSAERMSSLEYYRDHHLLQSSTASSTSLHKKMNSIDGYNSSSSSSSSTAHSIVSGSSVSSRHRSSPGKIYPQHTEEDHLEGSLHSSKNSQTSQTSRNNHRNKHNPLHTSSTQSTLSLMLRKEDEVRSIQRNQRLQQLKEELQQSVRHQHQHKAHHKSSSDDNNLPKPPRSKQAHRPQSSTQEADDENDSFLHTSTMMENELLGYQLAEDIRNLREELLHEKQSKRMILVANENLTEQLHQAEQRIHYLENSLQLSEQSIQRLERINQDEAKEYVVLSESKARLQREVNDLLQQQQNQQDSLHVFHHEQDQLKKQSTYWQEYTHGLELALKEMTKQSHVYEALLTEERQRSLQVEQNLNLLQRKQYLVMNQVEEVLDIASISLNPKLQGILKQYERMASAASGGVLPSHGNALDIYERWDFLVQVMKCKFHMYEKKILKSRSYVHKMMKVVKLYEEMLPEVEHFMTGMDSDEEEA